MPSNRFEFNRSADPLVYDRPSRYHPRIREPKRYVARFGCRMANSLLLLELGAARKLANGWDPEWFEDEFLARLGEAFFRQSGVTESMRTNFDWNAALHQYESLDLLLLDRMSRSGYRDMLLAVLRGIYDEEQLGGPITAAVRRVFRLPRF